MKRKKKNDGASIAGLCTLLNISRPALTRHLGRPDAPRPNADGRYDVPSVIQYVTDRRAAAAQASGGHPELIAARIERLKLQNRALQADYFARVGALVPLAAVSQRIAERNAELKTRLLSIPGRIARDLLNLTSPGEASRIVNDAIVDALNRGMATLEGMRA